MRKIVEIIKDKFGKQGIDKLTALLDIEDHKTNLSIATNLLNQVEVDAETEAKALEIIRRVSSTDELLNLGFKVWLEDYEKRRGSKNASRLTTSDINHMRVHFHINVLHVTLFSND